jgi:hypothetical protein
MCLHTIKDEKPSESGIGYKIVFKYTLGIPGYYFRFKSLNGSVRVPTDRWLRAEKKVVLTDSPNSSIAYESGFHIYKNRPNKALLPEALIVEVQYKGARILGLEFGDEIIVADQMYVPGPCQSIEEQL